MNKYLIAVSKGGNTVAQQLILSESIESALAEAKTTHGEGFSYAAHSEQEKGQFDSYPLIAGVCALNGGRITVKVYPTGWCAQVDGVDTPLSGIPSTLHSMVKAIVKSTAYDAGYYTFKVPGPSTARWDRIDWINYVTFNFDI